MSEKKQGPQPAYPYPPATSSNAPPYPMQQGPGVPPQGAPPAYTPSPPPGHMGYPQQPYYQGHGQMGAVPQAYPAYGQPPQGYPPQAQPHAHYPTNPGMPGAPVPGAPGAYPAPPVMVPGLFDAGARFDATSQPNIPPPPPGCAPNAAQMAAMQGYQVHGSQQKSNFWTDGAGGGVGFW